MLKFPFQHNQHKWDAHLVAISVSISRSQHICFSQRHFKHKRYTAGHTHHHAELNAKCKRVNSTFIHADQLSYCFRQCWCNPASR